MNYGRMVCVLPSADCRLYLAAGTPPVDRVISSGGLSVISLMEGCVFVHYSTGLANLSHLLV